jgi:hypothetical protein
MTASLAVVGPVKAEIGVLSVDTIGSLLAGVKRLAKPSSR